MIFETMIDEVEGQATTIVKSKIQFEKIHTIIKRLSKEAEK